MATIEELISNPPTVTLSPLQRVERAIAWVTAVVALVALLLALISLEKTAAQADCINTNLGIRQGPGTSDAQAHVKWAKVVDDLINHPTDRVTSRVTLQRATDTYVRTLSENQSLRAEHPLGQC